MYDIHVQRFVSDCTTIHVGTSVITRPCHVHNNLLTSCLVKNSNNNDDHETNIRCI